MKSKPPRPDFLESAADLSHIDIEGCQSFLVRSGGGTRYLIVPEKLVPHAVRDHEAYFHLGSTADLVRERENQRLANEARAGFIEARNSVVWIIRKRKAARAAEQGAVVASALDGDNRSAPPGDFGGTKTTGDANGAATESFEVFIGDLPIDAHLIAGDALASWQEFTKIESWRLDETEEEALLKVGRLIYALTEVLG